MTERVRQYVDIAAADHGVTSAQIMSRESTAPVCKARWGVMRALRDDGFTLAQIGRWLGRDHTTIMHGLRKSDQRSIEA